ncbi:hypothetical protein ASPSYDRAFT_43519 [Aspergillus sydowii CBS 593.65]|uniref:t-SNARE coiled-coil homology domain-containing protein n=1 Tax=Aspergillus sydowii CBS 593.65 TaxID=1036612 RepID=A0A1L9TQB8_9EURO|nr:uncharacterized protein ASPSYDRAFT_43519 [Aspergillus sydowii CBS 593.65]OJJ61611.1 hypothetical protein ASPSYDRAFT_43519 [Aspergillus sydowii CBS 593.65]
MSYGQSYNNYPAYGETQSNPYAGNQGYGQNQYGYGNQDVEMNPVQQQPADPNMLFSEVNKIKDGIQTLKSLRENQLEAAQNSLLASESQREDQNIRSHLDQIHGDINNGYEKLKNDMARIKKTPGSANVQKQLETQGRAIRTEFEEYQKSQMLFKRKLGEQVSRRIRMAADPETPEEEIQRQTEAVLAGDQQTFQVAGARSKKANDVKIAVMDRSAQIKKIEKDMIELSRLVVEINELVTQQAPAIENIDQGAERVAGDLGNANVQLGQAVQSARNARKWKWYALIIVIIIIAIIVAVAVGVTQSRN